MNRIFIIARYELWRNFRRLGYLFGTFGVPVIGFLLMFGFQAITDLNATSATTEMAEQFVFDGVNQVGYVDFSGEFSTVPERYSERILQFNSEADARLALQNGEIDSFYIIEDDYIETQNMTLHMPGFVLPLMTDEPMQALVYETYLPNVDVGTLTRLRTGTSFQTFNLERSNDGTQNEDADFILLYTFTLIFFMAIFLTNNYLLQSVIEEKENYVIEILVSTVTPTQLLSGKILAMSMLGLLQIIVFGSALVLGFTVVQNLSAFQTLASVANINFPVDKLPFLFAYFVVGYLFFAAVFSIIGAISNSTREAPQYAALLIIPAVIPLYFIGIFLTAPNDAIAVGFSMFPLTAPVAMIMRLSIASVPLIEIVASLSIMVISTIGLMWLAGRVFRVQTLLRGQTPKLRELPALFFGS